MGVTSACKVCTSERRSIERDALTPEQLAQSKRIKREYSRTPSGKLAGYKGGAKERGITFNLDKRYFEAHWQLPCSYCGDKIATIGLDRKDNGVGYSVDNVVSCCGVCNRMKLAMTKEDWYNQMAKILAFNSKTEKI